MSWLLPIAVVVATGLALGQLKVRGLSLGVAGVLFSGLAAGHLGFAPAAPILDALRDLGLVLFVAAVGAQVGPGFVQSLRDGGLRLNALAAAVVLLGALCTVLLARVLHLDMAALVGVFAGATTNTPALGAAQQALDGLPDVDAARRGLPGLGYAVAYPFGVLGVIVAIVGARALFGATMRAAPSSSPPLSTLTRRAFVIENKNLDGRAVSELPGLSALGVVVSRVLAKDAQEAERALPSTVVRLGDTVLAVGAEAALESACAILGAPSTRDLTSSTGTGAVRMVVTHKDVVGTTLAELSLSARHDVVVTRVRRGDVDMLAAPALRLRFGDQLHVVGRHDDLAAAAALVGNSQRALGLTDFLPIFLGIALGVLLGSVAVPLPGLPAPVKLGLAGGPLLVAIVLGRLGKIGPVVWYLPGNVNLALRELGIALFLSAVGLKAGAHLMEALAGQGLTWLLCGLVITLVPLAVVAAIAGIALKLPFATVAGLLAGSMTDPPALAFTNSIVGEDSAAISYAAVYPTTMVLRILTAQALILWLGGAP
ncbi:MAG: putative transporter [Deltaproteobacteria bacterium]|nr:putative transporter [Deltaproteobacteria bacterium]